MEELMTHSHPCDLDRDDVYRCGNCSQNFSTMCQLHRHFVAHDSGGSFHFDNLLKVGFAKYDSTCVSTQTESSMTGQLKTFESLYNLRYSSHLTDKSSLWKERKKKAETTSVDHDVEKKGLISRNISKSEQHLLTLNENKGRLRKKQAMDIERKSKQSHDSGKKEMTKLNNKSEVCVSKPVHVVPPAVSNETKRKGDCTLDTEETDIESFNATNIQFFTKKCLKDVTGNVKSSNKDMPCKGDNSEIIDQLNKSDECDDDNSYSGEELQDMDQMNVSFKASNENQHAERMHSKTDDLSCYNQHDKNSIFSFYKQNNRASATVKVSKTWSPSVPVRDYIQEMYIASNFVSPPPSETKSMDVLPATTDVKVKKPVERTVCDTCGKSVVKSRYEDHLNMHFGKKPFVCEICGMSYPSRRSLAMHKACSHVDNSEMFQCKLCNKKFPIKSRLKEHMLMHTKDQEFICKECGKIFFTKNSLTKHTTRLHRVSQYHSCPKCNKRFKSKSGLTEHMQSHTQSFSCSVCGMNFNRYSSRQRHMKTHTGEKPHKCHICGHEFIQKTPFWVHMEKHHDLTKVQLKELLPDQHGDRKCVTIVTDRPEHPSDMHA